MNEIIVFFNNGRAIRYTMDVYNLLLTDPSVNEIINAETGEILFCR